MRLTTYGSLIEVQVQGLQDGQLAHLRGQGRTRIHHDETTIHSSANIESKIVMKQSVIIKILVRSSLGDKSLKTVYP